MDNIEKQSKNDVLDSRKFLAKNLRVLENARLENYCALKAGKEALKKLKDRI